MSFLIATPTRARQMNVEYTVGLMQSSGLFGGWMPLLGQTDIYMARNVLANEFLRKTKHDSLIFIDSDIGFSRENLIDLAASPFPLVSGMYPCKTDGDDLGKAIFSPLDRETPIPNEGFIEAKYLPCGFLKIDRSLLEDIKPHVVEYGPPNDPNYQFFVGLVVDRFLLSEDYSFSELARRAGAKPMVNCKIRLVHDGVPLKTVAPWSNST